MDLLTDFAKLDMGIACVIREFVLDDLESNILQEVDMPLQIPTRKIGFAYLKENNKNHFIRELLDSYM